MEKSISDSKFMLSGKQVETAVERLQEHVTNKNFYARSAYIIVNGGYITRDFQSENQHRSWYKNTTFDAANLNGAGFSDSIFYSTEFLNLKMDNTGMRSCVFYDCTLQADELIKNIRFENSVFMESRINNTSFYSAGFTGCILNNTLIENCTFDNTAFEGAVFDKSKFSNVKFTNLNLEFVEFKDIEFDSVALPFNSIPFIFNGLNYLLETQDNVFVKSIKTTERTLTIPEYRELIPDLELYFAATKNYFPLANILIAKKDFEHAYECILNGITSAIQIGSFRMLRFFCRLLQVTKPYAYCEKRRAYQTICEQMNRRIMTTLMPNVQFHLEEIQSILFESGDWTALSCRIQTSIIDSDYESVRLFYELIYHIAHAVGIDSNYAIQYSYNSAADIFICFNQVSPVVLAAFIAAATTILSKSIDLIVPLKNHKIAIREHQMKIKGQQDEGYLNKQKVEKNDKELQLLEFKKQEKQIKLQHRIEKNDREIQLLNLKIQKKQIELQQMNEKLKTENDARFIELLAKTEQCYPIIENLAGRLKENGIQIKNYDHNATNVDHRVLSNALLEIIYSCTIPDR